MSAFDRLILLRAMRPDRVSTALAKWIGQVNHCDTGRPSARGYSRNIWSGTRADCVCIFSLIAKPCMRHAFIKLYRCVIFLDLQTMGTNYVLQKPYDMAETYMETSPATPMFFVLFPGVDPTPWVENLARTLDITTENGGHMIEYIVCAVA